jgi:predicted lipid-binding transport protein (Tim44 family)
MAPLIASGLLPMAMGSGTVALIGVLIPLVVILLISAVPIYFRLSERRRRKQGEEQIETERSSQGDIVDEVERLRRQQPD